MSSQPTSPFKFLDSYTAADKSIFFGRDQEVEEVYSKVFQSRLLLMYGASGTGKSSIINCGLANRFDDTDWLPVQIRRGGNILRSTFRKIQEEAIHQVSPKDPQNISKQDIKHAINSVFLDHFKPIYLIFDQFEELFIFGYKDEWKAFIDAINHLLESDLDVRFIFIIRGEYLEFLSEFEELIPDFFDNRIRIEKMTKTKAIQSISGPCDVFGINRVKNFDERLLNKLASDKSQVELTFLQVYLDKIYRRALEKQSADTITFSEDLLQEIGEIEDVLAEFLDEQIFQMEDSKAALTVLKSFVSLEGTKARRSLTQVVQYCRDIGQELPEDQVDGILLAFVNRRILKDKDENNQFELRHDSLAQKIFEKITYQEKELLDVKQLIVFGFHEYEKRGTLLNDDDLSYIASYERVLKLPDHLVDFIQESKNKSKKQRSKRKVRSIVITVIVFLLITSLIGFFYSQQQKSRAEKLAEIAELNAEQASQQRLMAESNAKEATKQAQEANLQRSLAEESRQEAENQRANALYQKELAEQEKLLAEKAQKAAEISEEQAILQREIALAEKRVSTRLRMLTLARELAIKTQFIDNPELKGLLSLLAFKFNQENGGESNQPEIYKALYQANQANFGEDFNQIKLHSLALTALIMSGEFLWSAGHDGKLIKYQPQNGTSQIVFESNEVFESMAISTSGERIALGTKNGKIYLLSKQGQIISSHQLNEEVVKIIADGETFFALGENGKISKITQNSSNLLVASINSPVVDLESLGSKLLVAHTDGSLSRINKSNLKSDKSWTLGQPIKSLAVSNDQRLIAVGFESGQLAILKTADATEVIRTTAHSAAITDIRFTSSDLQIITSSFDRSAAVWNVSDLRSQPIVLDDHESWVYRIAFDASNNKLLTGDYNGNINIYPLASSDLADPLCQAINRKLTKEEWDTFIANDIKYETACED